VKARAGLVPNSVRSLTVPESMMPDAREGLSEPSVAAPAGSRELSQIEGASVQRLDSLLYATTAWSPPASGVGCEWRDRVCISDLEALHSSAWILSLLRCPIGHEVNVRA
jgi:hypothetical protein